VTPGSSAKVKTPLKVKTVGIHPLLSGRSISAIESIILCSISGSTGEKSRDHFYLLKAV